MLDIGEIVAIVIILIVLFVGLVWLALRVTHLEEQFHNMPTHADLQRIETELETLGGRIGGLDERTRATARMLTSIHQHLLEGGNGHA